ncbi:MAG: acyl-CoA dehydrogenase [Acidobacteria bacterium]|nr:acyl-CoA dehydrogenase [Acidobacteriota bacterium]MCW5970353.1 acyl-CoA dehydrogenase [Blastocatellales bacterium]
MDLNLTPSETQFRDDLRAWLAANAPPPFEGNKNEEEKGEYFAYLRAWQRRVYDGGWAGLSWPKEYGGRGAALIEQSIFQEEWARAEAPPLINVLGLSLIGPTIIAVGTAEQKQRFLPKILSAEEIWCQGFSEPNAGSDVAALGTKAVLDGDHFVVNGQKIWTSLAHASDWCLLLVRTDANAAKHKGITALLVDMRSEGVVVRPLKQITGDSGFNEVFFSNVRVPAANVLGEVNRGWHTAIATLMNERAHLGTGTYVQFKRNLDALIARSRELKRGGKPASSDPVVRQKLAQAFLELEVFRLTNTRALSRMANSHVPGPEGSILKIYWSEMNQRLQQTAQEVLGPYGQLWDFDEGRWAYGYLRARGNTIEAGTSEIQRNIVAERVLGLPKSY